MNLSISVTNDHHTPHRRYSISSPTLRHHSRSPSISRNHSRSPSTSDHHSNSPSPPHHHSQLQLPSPLHHHSQLPSTSRPHTLKRLSRISNCQQQGTSNRILYDTPCRVCHDHSSGKHYGIFACDGCAGFFKRAIRHRRTWDCKYKSSCLVDKVHRNQCRACRLAKCLEVGMNREAVQHERGPRDSTKQKRRPEYHCDTTTADPDCLVPQLRDVPKSPVSYDMSRVSGHLWPPTTAAFLASRAQVSLPFLVTSLVQPVLEIAAQLILMNVQWVKTVTPFTRLDRRDQLLLLQESWRELFVLGAAQFKCPEFMSPEVPRMLAAYNGQCMDPDVFGTLVRGAQNVQDVIRKFHLNDVDTFEYVYLRAMVLFKPSLGNSSPSSSTDKRSLVDVEEINKLQNESQVSLNCYVNSVRVLPTDPQRFWKLLQLQKLLESVSTPIIEDLFFRCSIGDIPINRIICDMYEGKKPQQG